MKGKFKATMWTALGVVVGLVGFFWLVTSIDEGEIASVDDVISNLT